MSKTRDLFNNNTYKLAFYDRNSYKADIETSRFTEFKFNDKPLLKDVSEFQKVVYSNLQPATKGFTNNLQIKLNNPMLTTVDQTGTVVQRDFYTYFIAQGIDLRKDYIYRIYKDNGLQEQVFYTGVIPPKGITQRTNEILITLNTRLNDLSYLNGETVKTEWAGWPQNIQFEEALQILTEGTDVEVTGDVVGIDFYTTKNEGTPDIRAFDGSYHVASVSAQEVIICNSKDGEYGTKYNFITDTIEPFTSEFVIHYVFTANNGIDYKVVEKQIQNGERIANYGKLYLYTLDGVYVADLGYGRISDELQGFNRATELETTAIENYYIKDNNVDTKSYIDISYFDDVYHYYNDIEGDANNVEEFEGLIGQVIESDGYYFPLFQQGSSFGVSTHDAQSNSHPILNTSGAVYGGDYIYSADISTTNCDFITGATDATSRSRLNQSIKSRSYFVYDSTQNRLVFQRPSNVFPSGSTYDINTRLTKTWDSFGLNPIGYYSFTSDSLGYVDIKNDHFIYDWVHDGNFIYASMINPDSVDYTADDTTLTYSIQKISSTGIKTELYTSEIINGFAGYGLHFYDNNITHVHVVGDYWVYSNYDTTTDINTDTNISYYDFSNAITGSVINESGNPILLVFIQNIWNYIDIYNQLDNDKYPTTQLTVNTLGGYLIKAKTGDDFTGKIEDRVLTFITQVRGDLLDLTDLNLLQGFLKFGKMANKFMYIDGFDRVVLKNKGNLLQSEIILENIIDVVTIVEDYKSLDVKSYYPETADLFKSMLITGEYEDTVEGNWTGRDASFVMDVKVLNATQFEYTIESTSDILNNSTTQTFTVSDWGLIKVPVEDYFIILRFLEVQGTIAVTPPPESTFQFLFNSRVLKVSDKNTTTAVNTTGDISRVIDNRFCNLDLANFLLNDVKPMLLDTNKIHTVQTTDILYNTDNSSKFIINYPYYNMYDVGCYLLDSKINKETGVTTLKLKEV